MKIRLLLAAGAFLCVSGLFLTARAVYVPVGCLTLGCDYYVQTLTFDLTARMGEIAYWVGSALISGGLGLYSRLKPGRKHILRKMLLPIASLIILGVLFRVCLPPVLPADSYLIRIYGIAPICAFFRMCK